MQEDASLPGILELVEADLLENGSFDEAVRGCSVVVHTASPFLTSTSKSNPEAQLIRPAVEGTTNVLESVNRAESVTRVVLTSSVVAVMDSLVKDREKTYTEEDWNETATLKDDPYSLSKKLAEEKAWEMQRAQKRWTMATVNPGFVMGPSLSGRSNDGSMAFMKKLLTGGFALGGAFSMSIVDVRDVGLAHVRLALDHQELQARYLVFNQVMWLKELGPHVQRSEKSGKTYKSKMLVEAPKWLLWTIAPLVGLSREEASHKVGYFLNVSNEKVRTELGIEFRDIHETFQDMLASMEDSGMV